MTDTRLTPTTLSLAGFILVLLLAGYCYQPALSGAFQGDDFSNLEGLANIDDAGSAAEFIFNGTAGPAGRPLSLWSFALQAEQWQQGARAFLRVNIVIHLLNGILLAFCLYQMSLLRAVDQHRATMVAAAAAGMWLVMPLLATASLHVVQRMTTLSALFSLLGLCGYLYSRRKIEATPTKALLGMTISLSLGSALAILAKEIGLLLPAYVLVLEATILRRPGSVSTRNWRAWQSVFLLLPTVVVIAYLATRVAYPEWVVARRGFTVSERLLTQAQLLWVYLQKALLGVPSTLGLYQTPPIVSTSLMQPLALLATLSWLLLAGVSIAWRRRYPLLALAVLWFLTGHLLESTVLPLELYFEHRNYLPIVGPLFALMTYLLTGTETLRRIGMLVVPVFVLSSAYFLFTFASMSGEASVSSRYWAMQYPDSVRAVTNMATYQLQEEGPIRALTTLDQFVIEYPQHSYLRLQELNIRCLTMPDQNHAQVLAELRRDLPQADFTYTAGTMLSQLYSTVLASNCTGVSIDTVAELAELLQRNSGYMLVPKFTYFHHKLLASIARQKGDYTATIEHLETALAHHRSAELNMMMVTTLASEGDFNGAASFIDDAMRQTPANPLRAAIWRKDLENLRAYVSELERYSDSTE